MPRVLRAKRNTAGRMKARNAESRSAWNRPQTLRRGAGQPPGFAPQSPDCSHNSRDHSKKSRGHAEQAEARVEEHCHGHEQNGREPQHKKSDRITVSTMKV